MAASCPTVERWKEHLAGGLAPNLQVELTDHLDQCGDCQRTLEHLAAGGDSLLDVARQVGQPTEASEGAQVATPQSPTLLQETQAEAAASADDELAFLGPPTKPGALGRLGHYEALEVIGKGGFGIVLKAFDDKLHRVAAIKVLAPSLAASGTARKRFIREAQAAAAVKNEHVVAIYNVQDEAQPPYLVMELIDGVSLQDKLDKQGPLSLKEILRIGMQMAEGLAAAHKQGLVHRDIKPSNILLENGVERVKITDFGLARAVDDASVTQSGVIAGTPMYMSPEQANGEVIDHRSDLFSLGTVLYVMCTGRPPFRATGTMAVLKRVIEDTPRPVRETNPEMPDWLEAVIAKLHAKKPEERFQTSKEVAELLGQRLADVQAGRALGEPSRVSDRSAAPATMPPTPPRTPRGAPGRRSPAASFAILAGAVVAVVLAASGWLLLISNEHLTAQGRLLAPMALCGGLALGLVTLGGWLGAGHRVARRLSFGLAGLLFLGALISPALHHLIYPDRDNGRLIVEVGEEGLRVEIFATGKAETKRVITVARAGVIFDKVLPVDQWNVVAYRGPGEAPFHAKFDLTTKGRTVAVPGFDGPPPTKTDPGWVQLFNGKDLTGWRAAIGKKDAWEVKDGAIVGSGQWNYLFTEKETYRDFHLRAKVKISHQGDSGIMFRGPVVSKDLLQAQILNWADDNGTGSLFRDTIKLVSVPPPNIPADTWFDFEVIAQGDRIETRVNGKVAAQAADHKMLAGAIGLESGNPETVVHFKKIEIKELPRSLAPATAAIDLIPLARPNPEFGTWKREGNALDCRSWGNRGFQFLPIPFDLPPEYELEAEIERLKGGETISFAMTAFGASFWVGFDARPQDGGWSGMGLIEKKLPWENGTGVKGMQLTNGKKHTFRCTVRASGVVATLDGRPMANYKGGFAKLDGDHPAIGGTKFYIQSFGADSYRLHRFLLTPLTDSNAAPPPLAIAPFDAAKAKAHQDAWAKYLGVEPEITNSIGMKLRLIPPGKFLMGSPDSEPNRGADEFQHEVALTKPYWMGIHSVTVGQFRDFMKKSGHQTETESAGVVEAYTQDGWRYMPKANWQSPGFFQTDEHPVVCVSWHDAKAFCDWLSVQEGRSYALPTEAQWEYACRAGSPTMFSYGDDPAQFGEHAWGIEHRIWQPHPVGRKKANSWGLYDMYGNVWNMTADWYSADYYKKSPSSDPTGPNLGGRRVSRGGDWAGNPIDMRAAMRLGSNKPTQRFNTAGFRVALVGDLKAKAPPLAFAPFDAAKAKKHQEAWAKHLGVDVEFKNAIGMKLRLIPPGEFLMGYNQQQIDQLLPKMDNDFEKNRLRDSLARKERITVPFYLGIHEVTIEQFRRFVKEEGYRTTAERTGKGGEKFDLDQYKTTRKPEYIWSYQPPGVTEQHPVVFVTREDAEAFCAWLTKVDGRKYVLPTEAQWEFACRAGTTTVWWPGDDENVVAKQERLGSGVASKAGSLAANPFGLYDMHGNVIEWVRGTDSFVRRGGQAGGRVLWGDSARRVYTAEDTAHAATGFRVAFAFTPGKTPPRAIAPFDAAKAKEHQQTWAKYRGVPVEIENSIGMKLRLIPPGEFKMGTATNEIAKLKKDLKQAGEGRDSRAYIDREGLVHPVRLTRPWHMAAHEVTVAQFRRFVEATGYRTEAERDGRGGRVTDPKSGEQPHDPKTSWRKPGSFEAKDDSPVVQVSWNDCQEFCRWLSKKEGRTYRLATEAEWEFACRAGSERPYSFSDAFAIKKHIVFDQKSPEMIGSRLANAFGLFDMEGNVSEWCADWSAERYSGVAETDPQGPAEGEWRIYRGGAYDSAAWACRSAVRWSDPPTERYANTGFRVVLTGDRRAAPPQPAVAPFDSGKAKQHQDAWATHLGDSVEIKNSIGMKLRLIPPGEFDMGAGDKDADARPEEKPRHRVVIRNPFYIGVTEVTRSQYQAVMKQGGKFDPKPILDHPVVAVSWHDATRFCKLLSELDAEKKAGRVYRLPAEVEWEYACRAGTQTPLYFGDIGKIAEHAWFADNGGGFTNPVAKLKANPWGLHDMLGNVEEWCADTYDGYRPGKVEHDPTKPLPFGTGNNRVARSGSYLTPAKRVTVTARTQINPVFATPSLGLRVVMIAAQKAAPDQTWLPLFNGSNLKGWTGETKDWKVDNQVLMSTGKPALLRTEKSFQDFALRFETWLEPAGGPKPFLDVVLHGRDDAKDKGSQQILLQFVPDGEAGAIVVLSHDRRHVQKRGSFRPEDFTQRRWNQVEIHSRAGRIELFANGKSLAVFDAPKVKEGYIGLTAHYAGEWRFRKVEIKELNR